MSERYVDNVCYDNADLHGKWHPIESAPEAEPILVFCPKAHRGLDSCEVVVIVHIEGVRSYWTNGGPNGGGDFEISPAPTHWMPLPNPPVDR